MAKKIKKEKKAVAPASQKKQTNFRLSENVQGFIFIGLIALLLLILLKPFVLDGLSPQGVDVVGSIGASNQITQYHKQTGERALWNPNVFAGMPIYHRLPAVVFSADTVIRLLSRVINRIFLYYFLAALGFYLLMRRFKLSPPVAFFAALLFVLMPHYKSLYIEGHFSKFTAIMILPWVFYAFHYFLDKRNLLSAALFSLAFGVQIRTQHYQIVFYTALLIFAVGLTPFIRDLIDKNYKRFSKSTLMLVAAVVLALTMSAQPLFLAKEYLPYSKRGKTTIDVNAQNQKAKKAAKANGVSIQYATQWSTDPSETAVWLVPRFYGGMSNEKYEGSAVPRAKGQPVSGYWGHMPFTQSYEYMGVLTLLLAIIGLYFYRRERMIYSLALFAGFLILLSFGRHMLWFYSLFYNYVPFFNKFRAPMMSVTVTSFIAAIFAGFGLHYLSQVKNETKKLSEYKNLLYIAGGFFVLGIFLFFAGQMMSFVKPSGEPYQGQMLEIVKTIRKEYFTGDMIRYFVLLAAGVGLLTAYLAKKISFNILAAALILVSVVDLVNIQSRQSKKYTNLKTVKRQYFVQTPTDTFLKGDTEKFRIFPAGKLFGDNRWAYFHQTIGGYTPIKMYTIEELVEKNIYNGPNRALPINWNVLKILNVKYVILQSRVESPELTLVNSDPRQNLFTYRFNGRLPRGYFVDNYKVEKDEFKRLRLINSAAFDPAKTAVLEEAIPDAPQAPDSSYSRVTAFTPNHEQFEVYTDKKALFVISEVYYPPGWKIYIDDTVVSNIYKTDHAVQSVVVPAGQHKIDLRFEPESYYRDITIASVSAGIIYLTILLSLIQLFLKRRKQA